MERPRLARLDTLSTKGLGVKVDRRYALIRVMFCLTVAILAGCSSTNRELEPRLSLVETDPDGASVFVGGGFVGLTPASFYLPAQERVDLRIELPGYVPEEQVVVRSRSTPKDAPEGVGWDEVYYFPLLPKK